MSKSGISMYDDFEKVKANHVPLSPLSFLPRAASFYPDKEAVVYGNRHYTWAQTYERCKRLASAINSLAFALDNVRHNLRLFSQYWVARQAKVMDGDRAAFYRSG